MAGAGERIDYQVIHNFNVEIDQVVVGGFKEVDGLESKTEVIDWKEGNSREMKKRSGKTVYSNIILRRGYIHGNELWEWRKLIIESGTDAPNARRSGAIVMIGDDGVTAKGRYSFFNAWPCRWKGPTVSAMGDTHAVEEIELCVERWQKET